MSTQQNKFMFLDSILFKKYAYLNTYIFLNRNYNKKHSKKYHCMHTPKYYLEHLVFKDNTEILKTVNNQSIQQGTLTSSFQSSAVHSSIEFFHAPIVILGRKENHYKLKVQRHISTLLLHKQSCFHYYWNTKWGDGGWKHGKVCKIGLQIKSFGRFFSPLISEFRNPYSLWCQTLFAWMHVYSQ